MQHVALPWQPHGEGKKGQTNADLRGICCRRALLELMRRDIKPRDIMTRAAFENAMVLLLLYPPRVPLRNLVKLARVVACSSCTRQTSLVVDTVRTFLVCHGLTAGLRSSFLPLSTVNIVGTAAC